MRRLLGVLLCAALLAPVVADAQSQSVRAALNTTTCPGAGCVSLSVSGVGGVAVQVTGTFTGTLSFEGSIDGVNYVALGLLPIASTTAVTSTTTTGLWSGGVGGMAIVRVRMSAYTSGTATVSIQNAPTSSRSSGGGGGSGTIGGTIAQYEIAVGSGVDAISGIAPGTSGYVLTSNGAGANPTYQAAPGGTPGSPASSVQFNNAGSFAGSDDLLWDGSALSLGLSGAASSAHALWSGFPMFFAQEMAGGLTPGFVGNVFSATANDASGFFPMRSRGTAASPTAVQSGDNLGVFEPSGFDGTNWTFPASFQFRTTQAFTGTNRGTQAVLKLTSDGGSIQDKTYTFGQTLFTAPGGLNAAGGAFTVDGSGNLTVAGCTGCGASAAFSAITSGTNTTAAMVVGTGGSLAATGSGTITATAVPVGGISGLGIGVATFLATPSSANLASALTDGTGSGVAVFGTSPTLATPAITTSATLTRTSIGTTSADGYVLRNTTAAAAGAQQFSPRMHWTGNGWKTNATAASQQVDWFADIQPVQGTANPMNNLVLSASTAGGTVFPGFYLQYDGTSVGSGDTAGFWLGASGNRGVWSAQGFYAGVNNSATTTFATDGGSILSGSGLAMRGDTGRIAWSSGTNPASGLDTFLFRAGVGVLAQYNSTTPQELRVYNTRTDSITGEWFNLRWASNVMRVGVTKNGTGTARVMSLDFGDGSTSAISIPAASGGITFGGQILTGSYSTSAPALSQTGSANGGISFSSGGSYFITGGAANASITSVGIVATSSKPIGFAAGSADAGGADSAFARVSAGLIEVNNGTAGTYRDLKFRNVVGQTGYSEMTEMTAPAAGAANTVRIYAEDNGAGKTRLMAIFPTGAAQQIAIEP